MKTLKKAAQRNVTLNKEMYILKDIQEMLNNHEVCYFDFSKEHFECYDSENYRENDSCVIFLEKGNELKVEYIEEFGFYTTVLVKNDKKYYISL